MQDRSYFIHPSSYVDEGATIGEGTKVWHFCHVFPKAVIGCNCVLGQGCSVANNVKLGDGVKVQNGVSIYEGVVIEDGVFCGPHMVFTNVINPRSFVERKSEYRETRICKGASIGAGAVVVCGNCIGEYAFVGSGAVVTRYVKSYALVYGNPARRHGWVDRLGNKLDFSSGDETTGSDNLVYIMENDTVSVRE